MRHGTRRGHNRSLDFRRRSQSTNENDLGPAGRVGWAENTAVLNTFVSGSARGARGTTIRVATSPGLRINPRATGLANHSASRRKINAAYIIVRSLLINNEKQ